MIGARLANDYVGFKARPRSARRTRSRAPPLRFRYTVTRFGVIPGIDFQTNASKEKTSSRNGLESREACESIARHAPIAEGGGTRARRVERDRHRTFIAAQYRRSTQSHPQESARHYWR